MRPGVREGKVKRAVRARATTSTTPQYHFLWPGTTINIEPGRPNLGIDAWIPVGPGKTVGVSDYYFGPDVTDAEVAELVAFSQQVGAEDDGLVRNVQAGLDSGVVPQGRLLLNSEPLIAHFQRLVFDALAELSDRDPGAGPSRGVAVFPQRRIGRSTDGTHGRTRDECIVSGKGGQR